MIAILDYGMGNLRSVEKAIKSLGYNAEIVSNPKKVDDAKAVVLPGVGAFRDCMMNLKQRGLIEPIFKAIQEGKPFLGICLGLQVLFEESEEVERTAGLGILRGRVIKFSREVCSDGKAIALKIPHIGWNEVKKIKDVQILDGIETGSYFYFVHSYYVVPKEKKYIATTTHYGIEFASSISKENIFACQFHPEKSQKNGLKLLENFARMVKRS